MDSASSEQNDFEKLKDESDLWLILNLKSGPAALIRGLGEGGGVQKGQFAPPDFGDYTATPNRVEQGTRREILWWKQGYSVSITVFPVRGKIL